MDMRIKIISTGGTIDKVYFDQKSAYEVGDPQVTEVLLGANVTFAFEVVSLMKKDSLDLTPQDRQRIFHCIAQDPLRRFVVTHGTDTMIETAKTLAPLEDKVVVLTGSMQPARFRVTDAIFNIACAVTAVQILAPGVYIAMNGTIFDPAKARKNASLNRFETVP